MYWAYCFIIMVAIFSLWTFIETKRLQRRDDALEERFWERESKANSIRRKPIDHLKYIHIPADLPTELLTDNPEMPNIFASIETLRGKKIVNLTGYSNTDLKYEFGAPNITELSEYDQNFTILVTTLQKWADLLIDNGYNEEAIKMMEYLVEIRADIGKTYRLLGRHYIETDQMEKFDTLLKAAGELKSLNTKYICEALRDMKPF